MPKAILALRQYPIALLVAAAMFLCSLIIATQSLGLIRGGGGDDQGSGMGGTGKSGSFGDSGFGGTGGPVPYLGDSSQQEVQQGDSVDGPQAEWPAPWFPRELETADIPEEMQPLIELQRNPPVDPFTQPAMPVATDSDALRIQDLANDNLIAPETRRIIELANRQDSTMIEEASLEIQATIPEMPPLVETLTESLAQQNQRPATESVDAEYLNHEPEQNDLPPLSVPELANSPDTDGMNEPEGQQAPDQTNEELRRDTPERISRPELPPFQRMRPAVDRASIKPPRPQPMRI
ncbi:hypothetical protein [Pseudohongiella spirulinae]|uniref:Uncharacterized protein n=1 Tax=Pseudohongiella spirulinae TaxID=1249552 RepID=A0A0S2KCN4_9GAMM|nr:hypothetical protein [Pseudohongiella spirulinae]ALO46086.1 hypothetical protein PS2015_1429 [Pseudohongiella spirulinae]